ncbi:MAG: hypothetical protein JWP32_2141 [Schumannella sp.]|nr:hypothetical protein [Schumannella sp.]
MRATGKLWGAAVLGIGLAIALAGCAPGAPAPVPTDEPSASAGADGSTPAPTPSAPPELDLQGTATDNLAYFNQVNLTYIRSGAPTDGRSLIDNLVDAGFPKQAMEVTPDRTTVNAQADQVQFSVRLNGTCLIGQFGGGDYNGTAQPLLASNKCLIGTTRPIDW